jgi:DNA-binding IclR family transcriptional regulator
MSDAQGINSVEIAVTILEALAKVNEPARAIDLAQMTGLSKSRLHKYLVSLCRKNILYQNPHTNRYSFGQKLVSLSGNAANNYGIYHMINSSLSHLTDRVKCPTGLVIQKQNELSLIHYNHHNKKEKVHLNGSQPVPLGDSAAGKIFLTYSPQLRNSYQLNLDDHEFIKNNGYFIMEGDRSIMAMTKTISCPIFDHYKNLIAAAVVAKPQSHNQHEEKFLINHLMQTIEEIKQHL